VEYRGQNLNRRN